MINSWGCTEDSGLMDSDDEILLATKSGISVFLEPYVRLGWPLFWQNLTWFLRYPLEWFYMTSKQWVSSFRVIEQFYPDAKGCEP